MKCPHCGSDVNSGYRTCASCGGTFIVVTPEDRKRAQREARAHDILLIICVIITFVLCGGGFFLLSAPAKWLRPLGL